MDLKTRKRWSLVILLIGLPLYLALAWFLVNWIYDTWGRMPILLEFVVYVVLAIAWVFPCKRIFTGIGKEE